MTFTFTIDAFPAYTKFNKRDKVMAALQVIDTTGGAGHNYEDKTITGHEELYHRDDIYDDFSVASGATVPYKHTVFDQGTVTTQQSSQTAQPANPSEPAEPSGD